MHGPFMGCPYILKNQRRARNTPNIVLYGIRELAPAIPRTLSSTSRRTSLDKINVKIELISFYWNNKSWLFAVIYPRLENFRENSRN